MILIVVRDRRLSGRSMGYAGVNNRAEIEPKNVLL